MEIIFSEKFYESNYASDPAAEPGRLEPIISNLKAEGGYAFRDPKPATEEQIRRVHTREHYLSIKRDTTLYEMAALAAGGAILAADLAWQGKPTFAAIRPPGHHASVDSCWGFCYFNNISISLLNLFANREAKSAFIWDFDLHTGDGNINILGERDGITIVNLKRAPSEEDWLAQMAMTLEKHPPVSIITASAGFDLGQEDWGGFLSTNAYEEIGKMMKEFANEKCSGRRYALLEGGYKFDALGRNVAAFCRGFRE
ncbi:MAG: Deacetylase [Promethearchaeota archaeon CR_4]|nr:MAG: Deacetylase [Candidatus Lokiarchaeota archaeon CR_4]